LRQVLEVSESLLDDLLDLRVLSSLVLGDVTLEARLLSGLDFGFVDHGIVDLQRVKFQVQLVSLDDGLQQWSQGLLQVLETKLSSVVGDNHLGDDGISAKEVSNVLDNTDFVLNGQLEELQDEELFSWGEGV